MVNEASSEWTMAAYAAAAGDVTMEGNVTWPLLLFIVSIVLAVAGFVGAGVWVFLNYQARQRHDQRSHVDQRFTTLDGAIDAYRDALIVRLDSVRDAADARLRALESHKAELAVILKQMEQNHERTVEEFRSLREERREDMAELHKRFEGMDARFVQLVRGVKYITPDPAA